MNFTNKNYFYCRLLLLLPAVSVKKLSFDAKSIELATLALEKLYKCALVNFVLGIEEISILELSIKQVAHNKKITGI